MALAWDLRHATNPESWGIRPGGKASSLGFCGYMLLETGGTDYILLEDATSATDAIQLEDC
jgi:hypothetical protein